MWVQAPLATSVLEVLDRFIESVGKIELFSMVLIIA
jgi:hypothetical protein|tara:strand:- start:2543 stop:2650 length:108 start_codon:yes stop_codon:yes gene_type:complete